MGKSSSVSLFSVARQEWLTALLEVQVDPQTVANGAFDVKLQRGTVQQVAMAAATLEDTPGLGRGLVLGF